MRRLVIQGGLFYYLFDMPCTGYNMLSPVSNTLAVQPHVEYTYIFGVAFMQSEAIKLYVFGLPNFF